MERLRKYAPPPWGMLVAGTALLVASALGIGVAIALFAGGGAIMPVAAIVVIIAVWDVGLERPRRNARRAAILARPQPAPGGQALRTDAGAVHWTDRVPGPLGAIVRAAPATLAAVAILAAFALVACGNEMGTSPSPTRWAAPTASPTPSPSPLPSFEEEVAAGKHWQYRSEEHFRSGVDEQWLQSSLGSRQGFPTGHDVRLTVKCNHRGDLLVGITGMGLFTTSERIQVFYRTDESQEQEAIFERSSSGSEMGFIYQYALGESGSSPFYIALLSAEWKMVITIIDDAGEEKTVKFRAVGGLSQRIDELPCSIAP